MSGVGAGSIEHLPSGRHSPRMPDKTRLGVFDTEEEAERVLAAAIAELESGRVKPKNVKSFATAGSKWLDERELSGARDIATDRSRWDQYVTKAPFYDLALKRIAPSTCFEWRQSLRFAKVKYPYKHPRNGQRISPDTVERIFSLASAFMQDATNLGWVQSNPFRAAGKQKKKQARTDDPWTYLDPAEQTALLTAVPEGEREIVEALMCTGWRPSEAAWMPLSDVHLDAVDAQGNKTPYVDVRLSRGGKARKNGVPFRQYLLPRAADALERWLKLLPTFAPKNPHGVVFPLPDGRRRVSGKFFGEVKVEGEKHSPWFEWVEAAGIKRHVRVYDLRHTCATALLCAWWGRRWSLIEIQSHLGQLSSVSTRRYAHLAREAEQKAARETRGGASHLPMAFPRGSPTTGAYARKPTESLVSRGGFEPPTYGLKDPPFKPFRGAFIEACRETAGKLRTRKKLRVSIPRKIQRERKAG